MNERIKSIREYLGFTQKEFSKKIGIAFRSLQNYEGSSRKIPSDMLKELYTQFGIDPIWLLTGEGDMLIQKDAPAEAINEHHVNSKLSKNDPPQGNQTSPLPDYQSVKMVIKEAEKAEKEGLSEVTLMRVLIKMFEIELIKKDEIGFAPKRVAGSEK